MLEASTVCVFLNSPLGVALLAIAVVVADRYAPPWVKRLLERAGRGSSSAVTSPAAIAGDRVAAVDPTGAADDQVAELLGAVYESAAHRWPNVHRDEAVERFTVDLRGMNLYYRDERRQREAAAAAVPVTSLDVAEVLGSVERYG